MKRFLFFFFLGVVFLHSDPLWAQWHIEAQKIIFYGKKQTLWAEKDVVIKGKELTIFCPQARYEINTKDLFLYGPVKILFHGDILQASSAQINLVTYQGEIKQAFLYMKKEHVSVWAEDIQIIEKNRYKAQNAIITTCDFCSSGCVPDWSFHCRRLEVTLAGKAKGHHVTFDIRSLPVLYTPYLSLGLAPKRKSGFLLPRFIQSNREGLQIEWPFYWVTSQSTDLTFYPRYTSKRGMLYGIEARYVGRKNSQGLFRARYIHDPLKDDDFNQDGIIRKNLDRYWITGKVNQKILSYWLRLDLDFISDKDFLWEFEGGYLDFDHTNNNYLKRFGRGLEEKNASYRPSKLWINMPYQDYSFQFSSTYYQDLSTAHILSPIAQFWSYRPLSPLLGPFFYGWEFSSTYWWRENGYKGYREELSPKLLFGKRLFSVLEIKASSQLKQTFFWIKDSFGEDFSNETGFFHNFEGEGQIETGLNFYKDFSMNFSSLKGLRHIVRPTLEYHYRFFSSSENIPPLDPEDLLPRQEEISYGIMQYLTVKQEKENQNHYFDLGRIWLYQTYDLLEKESLRFSDLSLETDWQWPSRFSLKTNASYNFQGQGFYSFNCRLEMENYREEQWALEYRWDKIQKVEQINFKIKKILWRGLYSSLEIQHSLVEHETIEAQYGIAYRGNCWYADLKLSTTPDETRISFYLRLKGIGGIGHIFGGGG